METKDAWEFVTGKSQLCGAQDHIRDLRSQGRRNAQMESPAKAEIRATVKGAPAVALQDGGPQLQRFVVH